MDFFQEMRTVFLSQHNLASFQIEHVAGVKNDVLEVWFKDFYECKVDCNCCLLLSVYSHCEFLNHFGH